MKMLARGFGLASLATLLASGSTTTAAPVEKPEKRFVSSPGEAIGPRLQSGGLEGPLRSPGPHPAQFRSLSRLSRLSRLSPLPLLREVTKPGEMDRR